MTKTMEYLNAVGRRKSSVARVYFSPSAGSKSEFIVNKMPVDKYFSGRGDLVKTAKSPLGFLGYEKPCIIKVNVNGGGNKGQAESIKLGLSRALSQMDEETRKKLRASGFLTRDSRVVERKKPGRRKARKKEQYSKR